MATSVTARWALLRGLGAGGRGQSPAAAPALRSALLRAPSAGPRASLFSTPSAGPLPGLRSLAVPAAGGVRQAATTAAPAGGSPTSLFAPLDTFERRHNNGPADNAAMLSALGIKSVAELVDQTVPSSIRAAAPLSVGAPQSETEALAKLKALASQNQLFQNHIGMGYAGTHTPLVVLRNVLENPGWYTQYTPYQAEIAQGRLESLLNFQTMVCDLTGLPVANASLLDEATAAAEAMSMCHAIAKRKKPVFLVASNIHPQTVALLQTRAEGMGITVELADASNSALGEELAARTDVNGVMLQYPASDGTVEDMSAVIERAHAAGAKVVMATDLLALTLLKPPGELGADFALGNSQRFGVPMGYGGPHAAFFATKETYKRQMPGRIIGVSRDADGRPALRMAMQTREQHIRRDKATSNICTAQALLANMAAMFAVYHGPDGLTAIAARTAAQASVFADAVRDMGLTVPAAGSFFDTVKVTMGSASDLEALRSALLGEKINVRYMDDGTSVTVSFDETHGEKDMAALLRAFASATGKTAPSLDSLASASTLDAAERRSAYGGLARTSSFLTHPIFNSMHTEHELLRYIHRLQSKDLSLTHSMIALGSCTMKLNATAQMVPVTWPELCMPHPFAPVDQMKGYAAIFDDLRKDLADITGFHSVSLQPNSGAQGEFTGLLAIKKYHQSRGDAHRDICIIPTSAHGTNPASAKMCGMTIVAVGCDDLGNIDVAELRAKAEQYKDRLAALMVTYPSTHGVFEDSIKEVVDIIHTNGGQVYMDGANMNAQVGLCSPGEIGADVCHLNLHKTFCIPHGGGGPGMGPIGVAKQLTPFLPNHPLVSVKGSLGESTGADGVELGPVSGAPFGSSAILPISYMYIKMMGTDGLREATENAILNANYMAKRLEGAYNILYRGTTGRVAHEFILDLRPFKSSCGIGETDVAKRLQDYGFHSPTMSWPVSGTLMVEPTESESKAELDRFCDAMLLIREEIRAVDEGRIDKLDNPLKNAPHTARKVMSEKWEHPYSRDTAAFPASWTRDAKFWPTTSRVDDVFGDRNLVCTCPPMEAYMDDEKSAAGA